MYSDFWAGALSIALLTSAPPEDSQGEHYRARNFRRKIRSDDVSFGFDGSHKSRLLFTFTTQKHYFTHNNWRRLPIKQSTIADRRRDPPSTNLASWTWLLRGIADMDTQFESMLNGPGVPAATQTLLLDIVI